MNKNDLDDFDIIMLVVLISLVTSIFVNVCMH